MVLNSSLNSPPVAKSLEYEIVELQNLEKVGTNTYKSLSDDPSIYFTVKNLFLDDDHLSYHIYFHCLIYSKSQYIKSELFFPSADGSYSEKNSVGRYCTNNVSQAFLISSEYFGKKLNSF